MKTFNIIAFALILGAATIIAAAQDSSVAIPAEAQTFVEKGSTAIYFIQADLNADGTEDAVLVTEKPIAGKDEETVGNAKRSLLLLVRGTDSKLMLAKRNEKVIYCKTCGGVFGDPFAGIDVKSGSLTVNNYGGGVWRWGDSFQFNYSRRDRTWQLVRIEKTSFNATNPGQEKTKIQTPKSFGKIDIADFDPDKVH